LNRSAARNRPHATASPPSRVDAAFLTMKQAVVRPAWDHPRMLIPPKAARVMLDDLPQVSPFNCQWLWLEGGADSCEDLAL
jgi:hypothetical protein